MWKLKVSQLSFIALFILFETFLLKYAQAKYTFKPIKREPGLPIFSTTDLEKYDGSKPDTPIYLAIRGVVFDVTSGKGFYQKGSDYQVLAGKDASRAHALWSLDPKDLIPDLSGLTDDQLRGLDQVFEGTYLAKYPVVGYMEHFEGADDSEKHEL